MDGFGDRAEFGGNYGQDQPFREGYTDQQRPYYEESYGGVSGDDIQFAGDREREKYAAPQETYDYGKFRYDDAPLGPDSGEGKVAYDDSQRMGGDEDEIDDDLEEEEKERRKLKRRERIAEAVAAGAAGFALYEHHKVKDLDEDADEREED